MSAGDFVRTLPPPAYAADDTVIANIANTSYEPGSPEVGVYFTAPPSGTVRLTIGGGFRDNGASAVDRVFLAPQVFLEDSDGTVVLAASVTQRGYLSVAQDTAFQYGSRVSLVTGLLPGRRYYIRCMHLTSSGADPDSADIAARDLIVIPMP